VNNGTAGFTSDQPTLDITALLVVSKILTTLRVSLEIFKSMFYVLLIEIYVPFIDAYVLFIEIYVLFIEIYVLFIEIYVLCSINRTILYIPIDYREYHNLKCN